MKKEKSFKLDGEYNPNPSSPDHFSNLDTSSDEDIQRANTSELDNKQRYITDEEYRRVKKFGKRIDAKPGTREAQGRSGT